MPATGIWQLRELAKRTFIMMNERGMAPITFPHMTSFSPLPVLSFATMQYDWEWKYSEGDVQDRFTPEYLQLVSNGDLAGVWPVMLHDQGKLADDPWTQRTFTAVRLVHELDGIGGFGCLWMASHKANYEALAKPVLAMLDKPGLQVYKYWEDRPLPISTLQPELPAIVYSVPGKEALVVITGYAQQEETATLHIDTAALGLGEHYHVIDVEKNTPLPMTDGMPAVTIKKHDVRILRVLPGGA